MQGCFPSFSGIQGMHRITAPHRHPRHPSPPPPALLGTPGRPCQLALDCVRLPRNPEPRALGPRTPTRPALRPGGRGPNAESIWGLKGSRLCVLFNVLLFKSNELPKETTRNFLKILPTSQHLGKSAPFAESPQAVTLQAPPP